MSYKIISMFLILLLSNQWFFCMTPKNVSTSTITSINKDKPVLIKIIPEGNSITHSETNSDNEFLMPFSHAKLSTTLQDMINVLGKEQVMGMGISLSAVDPESLAEIMPFWNQLAQINMQMVGGTQEEKLNEQMAKLEPTLVPFDFNKLYTYIELANYLDLRPLLHALCLAFANKIKTLDDIKAVINFPILKDVSFLIAHYVIKNNGILEYLVGLSKYEEHILTLGTVEYNAHYFSFLGMNSTSINEKGDIAYCFQNDDTKATLKIYDSTDNHTRTIVLPAFVVNPPKNPADSKEYYQLSCALSPDSSMVACIGKIDEDIQILIADVSSETYIQYKAPSLKAFPLLSTFSSDGKKLCVASGADLYIYDVQDINKQPIHSVTPSFPIKYLFSHTYDRAPYLILKAKDVPGYFALNIHNPGIWEPRTTLEPFDFEQIKKSAGYKTDSDIIPYKHIFNTFSYEFVVARCGFNFYTYKLCFLKLSTSEDLTHIIDICLINMIPTNLRDLIKAYNIQNLDLINALYLLAFKIHDWKPSLIAIQTIFDNKPIYSYITECIKIAQKSYQHELEQAKELHKKSLIETLRLVVVGTGLVYPLAYYLFFPASIIQGSSSSYPRYLTYAYLALMGMGSIVSAKESADIQFRSPSAQRIHTLMRYLRYGLSVVAPLSVGYFLHKYLP